MASADNRYDTLLLFVQLVSWIGEMLYLYSVKKTITSKVKKTMYFYLYLLTGIKINKQGHQNLYIAA